MINLQHIRYAVAVEEHGHFGRAARQLGVSQPALSRAVQALETELGVAIFERGRAGACLTERGAVLLSLARQVLLAAEDLERESALLRQRETHTLNLTLAAYPAARSGQRAIGRLLAGRPELSCHLHLARWQDALEALLLRDSDLALTELTDALLADSRLATEPVSQAPGVFCCRAGHALLATRRLTLDQLLTYPWASTRLPARAARFVNGSRSRAGRLDPRNMEFVPAVEVDDVGRIGELVADCDALGLVTLSMVEGELESGRLAVIPLTPDWLRLNYGFVHLARRTLSAPAQAYMQIVREMEEEIATREASLWRRFVPGGDRPARAAARPHTAP